MLTVAREAAGLIRRHRNDSIEITSHMDADGVCAAAIVSKALDRENIKHHVKFVRMLYRDVVEQLEPADLTIFTDLGSSQLQNVRGKFLGKEVIIADHHKPEDVEGWPELVHLNAHRHGVDGMREISGAGMAYLIARELSQSNQNLSALAIVGAIGDVQNAWGRLCGYNRKIARDAIDAKVIERKTDLMLYGRHTRSILKALECFTDPRIPNVSNSIAGCVSLLKDLNIPVKNDESWRRPVDLTDDEKQRLATELIARAYTHVPKELIQYIPGLIIGETYTLLKEDDRSILRDASSFATCMNSTARHEQPMIGFEVAKGDRGVFYNSMLNLLRYHSQCIAKGMEFIEQNGLKQAPRGYLQYFDATGVIKETLVGIIAGFAIGYHGCDPYKPVVGVVKNGEIAKISARCSKLLFLNGIDLAQAIREAAKSVGGEGGGHAIACGAEVAADKVPEFLKKFEELAINQFG